MNDRRFIFLIPFLFLIACAPRETPPPPQEESLDVLTLKLRAREEEAQRFKQNLKSSTASRFKEEADLQSVEERLTAVRLQLDILRTSDAAAQPKAREEFNGALSDLTQFLHEVETRYAVNTK